MAKIEFENISKSYDGVKVLDGLSGVIEDGKVVSLIGRNGIGKTTLLEILIGLRKPDVGTVKLDGIDLHEDPEKARQKVAFVSETCNIYSWMTSKHLESFLKPLYNNWSSELYQSYLDKFAIPKNKSIGDMSKGSKHKLMLASAIAIQPEIMILDEPLSGFDPVIRDEVLETLIDKLCESGVTIIISSHQIDDIEKISDHAFMLIDGKFKINSSIEEIDNSIQKVVVKLEEAMGAMPTDEDILSSISSGKELELIVQNYSKENVSRVLSGLKVKSVSSEHISLREILVKLTKSEKQTRMDN